MARAKRAPVEVVPADSALCFPERLSEFVMEDWSFPDDDDTHGVLSRFTTAECRWRTEVRLWADLEGVPLSRAVAMARRTPNWNTYRSNR